jgi:hypothetical protein
VNATMGRQGIQVYCTSDSPTELCDEREAAGRLRLSVATLRRRRRHRQPPAWVKLGSRVFYRKKDLESFIDTNLVRLPTDVNEDNR